MTIAMAAVLTGDIISSRQASSESLDRAMAVLEQAAGDFSQAYHLDLRFTRFRGDGWQVVVERPTYALRAMVYLRARLMAAKLGLDSRIAGGFGEIKLPATQNLASASGSAFYVSGDLLASAGNRRLLIGEEAIAFWQDTITELIDAIMTDWTAAQAEACAHDLLGDQTQETIAERLGISRQAVQQRLAAAKIAAVEEGIATVEATIGMPQ